MDVSKPFQFNSPSSSSSSPLPRILCLHGGGTSGAIFNIQTIRIQRLLKSHFQFIFLDGPFTSSPGPGVEPFFSEMGPFYRWTRRSPEEHGERVREVLADALKQRPGGDEGPVVGVLGFSQGATMAAGLLYEQQQRREALAEGSGGDEDWEGLTDLKFGVLAMGGHPILYLSNGPAEKAELPHRNFEEAKKGCIKIPTIHLHGLQDQYVENGRLLLRYFDPANVRLFEYDVEHRLPIERDENEVLAQAILKAYETGSVM